MNDVSLETIRLQLEARRRELFAERAKLRARLDEVEAELFSKPSARALTLPRPGSCGDAVLKALAEKGTLKASELAAATGYSMSLVALTLTRMKRGNLVTGAGHRLWTLA